MKVNAWKTIDVECEVDVDLDDVLRELMDIADSEDGIRRKKLAIDSATRILERVGAGPLDGLTTPEGKEAVAETIKRRLAAINHWVSEWGEQT